MAFTLPTVPLDEVLNASVNGQMLMQPLLNKHGQVSDFRYVFINNQARSIAPALRDLTPNQTLLEIYPESATRGLFPVYVEVWKTGNPYRNTVHDPYNDEWYDLSIARHWDLLRFTFNKVTASYRLQQQAQAQRDLLQSILDTSDAGIVLYEAVRNEEGRIEDFIYRLTNPANARVTGRTVEEMTGQRMGVLFPSTLHSEFFERLVQVTETRQPQQWTFYFDADGIQGWFDASLIPHSKPDAAQTPGEVLFTFSDITAVKESEQAQERQAILLDRILNGSLNGLYVLSAIRESENGPIIDFRIEMVNRSVLPYLLRPQQTLVGKPFSHLFPEYRKSDLFAQCVTTVDKGVSSRFTLHYTYDGLNGWFEVSVQALDNGLVLTFIDITALKRAQERAEAISQELERVNARLERFAFLASHDLREPLRKVRLYSEMLGVQHTDGLTEQGRTLTRRIVEATERLQALVRNLLTYSQLSTQAGNFGTVSLGQVVEEVLADLLLSIEENNVRIDVADLPTIVGDAVQMAQLFQNLLTNAIKFKRVGPDVPAPYIRIDYALVTDGDRPERLVQWPSLHRISVSDNGIGIDPQFSEQIFGLFQRLHSKSDYAGTGLGLAICREVVENHGGLIQVESTPNAGATFLIYLPVDFDSTPVLDSSPAA